MLMMQEAGPKEGARPRGGRSTAAPHLICVMLPLRRRARLRLDVGRVVAPITAHRLQQSGVLVHVTRRVTAQAWVVPAAAPRVG